MTRHHQRRVLVTGLEGSCGKVVAKIFASNLDIRGWKDWDGNMRLSDKKNLVSHMSLPTGNRFFFYIPKIKDWDIITISTRDYNCSLESKVNNIQHDKKLAEQENDEARHILSEMIKFENVYTFSYESWFLLGDSYVSKFLNQFNIEYLNVIKSENVNKKYLKT